MEIFFLQSAKESTDSYIRIQFLIILIYQQKAVKVWQNEMETKAAARVLNEEILTVRVYCMYTEMLCQKSQMCQRRE